MGGYRGLKRIERQRRHRSTLPSDVAQASTELDLPEGHGVSGCFRGHAGRGLKERALRPLLLQCGERRA